GHMINANGVKLTAGAGKLVASDSLTAKSGSEIEIANNKVNLDKVSFKNGSQLNLKVDSLSNYGAIEANNITIEEGAKLSATLGQGIVKIGQEETLQLLKADNTDFNNFADSFDNNMYHFAKADTNGAYLISQVKTAEEVVEESGGTATEVEAAAAWVDGDTFEEGSVAAEVADALADLAQNDAKGFDEALSVIAPNEAPDVKTAATDLSDKLLLTLGKYLSNQDIGGLSSGDVYDDVTLWAKGYYGKSKLSNYNKVKGFDTTNKGVIAGLDKKLNGAVKVGFGFQYNASDVDSYHQKADVNTLTGFVYGEYRPSKWFVSGVASYGKSDYDEKKYTLGKEIKDNYSADVYSLQALTGYDFKYATPEMGMRYYRIKRHGYEDNIGQAVSGKDMDLLRGVAGVRMSREYGMFKPEIYAGVTYDFVSEKDNAIVSLPNGSSYTVAGRSLKRFGTEFNLSVSANVTDELTLSVGYEGKFREHYQDHAGMVNVKYEF
nr:autotransporter outer membrane beta-barrel domain-containing protein [Prevotella sp.]